MRKIKVEVIQVFEITIDEKSEIVKEYKSEEELISDLVSYNFSVLPVIGKGVTIDDIEVLNKSFYHL